MAMLMVSAVGFAQGTMTEENATLSDMGYRLEKDVNWYEGTINGTVFYDPGYEYGSGADCLSYTDASDNGIKLNNYSINQCINENMEWFYLQLTGNGITCEPERTDSVQQRTNAGLQSAVSVPVRFSQSIFQTVMRHSSFLTQLHVMPRPNGQTR